MMMFRATLFDVELFYKCDCEFPRGVPLGGPGSEVFDAVLAECQHRKLWTIDFKATGPRAARAWLNGYAGEYGFGIENDPEEITGEHDLTVILK